MNSTNKERFMYILGGLIVLAIMTVIGLLIFYPIPTENKETLIQVIGTLTGAFMMIISYFFGSSKSSSDKNEMLAGKNGNSISTP